MKKIITLVILILLAGTSFANATELPTATKFEAYNYSDFSYTTGDWALGMYNEDSNNPVFEIDIISGDNERIAGHYTLSENGYNDGKLHSCSVVIPDGEGQIICTKGSLDITFVKTTTDPFYNIKGSISDDGENSYDIDLTIPCVYALNYLNFILGGNYDITLLDDPDAVDPNIPLDPTGEVKEIFFGTDVRFQDQTATTARYWQIEGYTADNEYYVSFSPSVADHVAGSYSTQDMDDYYSILIHYPDTEDHKYIKFQSGMIIVTVSDEDVTVDADILGYDGIEYKICISTDETLGIKSTEKAIEMPAAKKILKDKKVYIIKDGKIFDTEGKGIKM